MTANNDFKDSQAKMPDQHHDKEKMMPKALLNEFEASKWLSVSVATLRCWRSTHRVDLPFVRLGRAVRYRPEDLLHFVEAGLVSNDK